MLPNGEAQVPWIDGVYAANEQPEAIMPPREQIHMLDEKSTRWLPEHHAQRKKKAVALISNMNPQNKRLVYVKEQAKHIDVDFYGSKWLPCPREGDTCLRTLALRFGMLQVVMGAPRDDYCALAPPNSFINVDDFSSPAELADYLHWLDTNDNAYASYFAWKAHGKVVVSPFVYY
ncbi:unnamed protein product [Dibothriocephalus latus]|uniref:Fucosyltransferase n=1 Tax=Dibothriocephalus latus TaxID=60516 RepID=A0A3P7KYG0_DIBLA|nr:unnamed protein product [Dibothriocephalus latus]